MQKEAVEDQPISSALSMPLVGILPRCLWITELSRSVPYHFALLSDALQVKKIPSEISDILNLSFSQPRVGLFFFIIFT